jgi:uncharacterized membrane-anchored protein
LSYQLGELFFASSIAVLIVDVSQGLASIKGWYINFVLALCSVASFGTCFLLKPPNSGQES